MYVSDIQIALSPLFPCACSLSPSVSLWLRRWMRRRLWTLSSKVTLLSFFLYPRFSIYILSLWLYVSLLSLDMLLDGVPLSSSGRSLLSSVACFSLSPWLLAVCFMSFVLFLYWVWLGWQTTIGVVDVLQFLILSLPSFDVCLSLFSILDLLCMFFFHIISNYSFSWTASQTRKGRHLSWRRHVGSFILGTWEKEKDSEVKMDAWFSVSLSLSLSLSSPLFFSFSPEFRGIYYVGTAYFLVPRYCLV